MVATPMISALNFLTHGLLPLGVCIWNFDQEDAFLQKQYPIYADSNSVFALLSSEDLLDANERTEGQIKRRVKTLGLAAAKVPGDNDSGEEERSFQQSADEESGGKETKDGRIGVGAGDDVSPDTRHRVRVRKIKRKNQEQSDDDSDGMFSSLEVRITLTNHQYSSLDFVVYM